MPTDLSQNCYCGNSQAFSQCCEVFIQGKPAPTPEKLMRSRYSAFATANTEYIFKTQDPLIHKNINKENFQSELENQKWIRLEVISSDQKTVAFIASMLYNDTLYTMKENSYFEMRENLWIYSKALSHEASEQAVQRNDTCPCGSQKKYKKCCQKV